MTTRSERIFAYAFLTLFSIIALYPVVGTLLLALHPRDALVSGLRAFRGRCTSRPSRRPGTSRISRPTCGQLHRLDGRRDRIDAALHPQPGTPSARCGSAGRTGSFYLLISGMIMPVEAVIVPLYYDFDAVGLTNTYWAAGAPADRAQRVLRHLLDARLLPLGAEDDARGCRDRRGRQPAHAVRGGPAAGPSGGADPGPADVHVLVERVPAAAGDGDRREPAYGAARPAPSSPRSTPPTASARPRLRSSCRPDRRALPLFQRSFIQGMATGRSRSRGRCRCEPGSPDETTQPDGRTHDER